MEFTKISLESIAKMRKRLGLTQKQLAVLAGVSQSLIAKIEMGGLDPSYSNVVKIFSALEAQKKHKSRKVDEIMSKNLQFASPTEKIDSVMKVMEKEEISQLPVLSKGSVVGSISDAMFLEWFSRYGNRVKEMRVAEVMGESFPSVPVGAEVEVAVQLLKYYRAVLVKKEGKIIGIVTRADLMKAME
ncbi:MAG: CBS domain-containing protein [Candidatus Micrarchaeota archaeon]